MNSLVSQIVNHDRGVAIFFLGQAGFILKGMDGTLLGVDLYLSNCCERYYGFKRLMPCLLDPSEVIFDYLIATHSHEDHFDVDSLPNMMLNGHTKLLASPDAYQYSKAIGLPIEQCICLSEGMACQHSGLEIRAVFCDHGAEMPDAIGIIIRMEGKSIYMTGDTALRLDKISEILQHGPFDVLICPINGKFGNMDQREAVSLCKWMQPKIAIPCHYWNFAEHGGDPQRFSEEMKKQLPNQSYRIMAMGEKLIL